ncbi:MAG: ATP-binding protein [Synergistaceae bacterium]|nr:ATP-binding protein [Synergistaceae bacterium]
MIANLLAYSMPNLNIPLHDVIDYTFKNNCAAGNLWHNYLACMILLDVNFFSLSCERRQAPDGALKDIALNDFEQYMKFFHYKRDTIIFKSEKTKYIIKELCEIAKKLADSKTPEEFYNHITSFYENYGVGIFSLNRAFKYDGEDIIPVISDNIKLADIVGYEIQKNELIRNTEAFIAGRPANNVLLYGDGGTGKSSSVKALLNEYFSQGLRVIEIYKHQFKDILKISGMLRRRNYKFIIFIDDLSFEENESDYKFLKAIIEGGIESKPENILIYATSNRRHIVREIWKDRDDMEHNGDIHRSDTVEEKLSLASRFGIALNYSSPSRENYHEIVISLANKAGLNIEQEKLLYGADRWEIQHGGKTGRAARQYIDYLLGENK